MATISLKSTKDASTIAGGATGTILASDWNGFDQHHPVGSIGSTAYRVRSLIYFPISFSGISSITSASLILTTSTAHNSWGSATKTLNVARSLVPWTEEAGSENSWTSNTSNVYNGYTYHNTAGTDYDTTDQTSVSVSGTRPSTVTIDVTAQVNTWFGGATNNGFILYLSTETLDTHYAEFFSREYATSSARPTLNITYQTNTAPTAPTVNSPAGGSALRQDGGVTFNFTQNDVDANDYISGYQIQVSATSGDFTSPVIDDTVTSVTGTLSTISKVYARSNGLTPLTTYYWRVRTRDSAGAWSPFSSDTANTFKINLAPSTPSGLSPSDTVVTTLTPTFTATSSDTDSGDRIAYANAKLYLASNNSLVWNSGDVAVSANGAFAISSGVTLSPSTAYYWTSYTKDTFGYSSEVSSSASFTTFAGGVTLSTPNDDTNTGWVKTLTPTFTFTATSNISAYTLKVYDTSGSLYTTVSGTPTPATSISYTYASTALQWNNRYFWTVAATVGGIALAESSQAMFHTNSKPVANPLTPSDGAAVPSLDPTFDIQFSDADLSYGLADSPTSLEVEVSRVSDSVIMYTLTKTASLGVTSNAINKATSGVTVTAGAGGSTLTLDVQYRYRSRYKDNAGASANNTGDWSAYRVFKPTTPPTVSSVQPISADLTTGAINKPTPTIQYGYTGSSAKAQNQQRVVAKNNTSGIVLYDSGFVVSTAASGSTPTIAIPSGYLTQGIPIKFEVTVKDSELVPSATQSSSVYNATWTPPADVDGVSATSENGSVVVRWDTVSTSGFLRYEVYRSDYGASTWKMLGSINAISTTSFVDFSSAIGKQYDYQVLQYATVGGVPLGSNPLTAITVTSSSNEDNWFIVAENNYSLSLELYAQSESRSKPFQEEIFEPFGKNRKVIVRTSRYGTEGTFEAFIPSDEASSKLSKLDDILSYNAPVYLKDPYGSVLRVYIGSPDYSYQPTGHVIVNINYIEVD
jgi:hypothetical protein